ncbi:hypothetical protein KM043_007355 [Ampulex compressa]|nr:hypothetical protein KM043_007355 [Ampulex compressa]
MRAIIRRDKGVGRENDEPNRRSGRAKTEAGAVRYEWTTGRRCTFHGRIFAVEAGDYAHRSNGERWTARFDSASLPRAPLDGAKALPRSPAFRINGFPDLIARTKPSRVLPGDTIDSTRPSVVLSLLRALTLPCDPLEATRREDGRRLGPFEVSSLSRGSRINERIQRTRFGRSSESAIPLGRRTGLSTAVESSWLPTREALEDKRGRKIGGAIKIRDVSSPYSCSDPPVSLRSYKGTRARCCPKRFSPLLSNGVSPCRPRLHLDSPALAP